MRKSTLAAALAVVMLVAAVSGCASQAKRRQADLGALTRALPGVYGSSGAQADQPGASAVTLSITPASAQVIGDVVLFVRETAADNAQLVLAQSIWTLALDPHGKIVQHDFLLKDPRRWLGAAQNPDLLVSLLPADLMPLPGCDLTWQKTTTGFAAASAQQKCRPGSDAQGLWIEQSAQLTGNRLTLLERRTAPSGALESAAPLSLTLERGTTAASP